MKNLHKPLILCFGLFLAACGTDPQTASEVKTSEQVELITKKDTFLHEMDEMIKELDENGKKVDKALEKLKEQFEN